MKKTIQLDIISDVVCPWCIIGYKHLETAINELGIQDQVEITWQPFELNPDMPLEGEGLRDHVKRKYGSSEEESIITRQRITSVGAEAGFEFNFFDDMKMVNTFEAHILLEYAHQFGKQHELKMQLFDDFFTHQKDVSQREILKQALEIVGLDSDKGLALLDDADARDQLLQLENSWKDLGISSVPTIIFDRKSMLSGAHPVENFKQILSGLTE